MEQLPLQRQINVKYKTVFYVLLSTKQNNAKVVKIKDYSWRVGKAPALMSSKVEKSDHRRRQSTKLNFGAQMVRYTITANYNRNKLNRFTKLKLIALIKS